MCRKCNSGGIFSVFLFTALFFLLNFETTTAQEKTLYERLGGLKAISMVVDDFIDRLLVNEVINSNPTMKAGRENSPAAYLKVHLTNLVCQVTGGPCNYTGLGMKESHHHLNISEKEWQAMGEEFKITLDKFGVPVKEQQELFDIVESTKKDIVMVGEK